MSGRAGWTKANNFDGDPCPAPGCEGKLAALYNVVLSAPYDWRQVGFTKSTIKCKNIGVTAVMWEWARPFCPTCGWNDGLTGQESKSATIMRLMRALIMRGVPPSEVQQIVGDAVSAIDVLAATHPEIED